MGMNRQQVEDWAVNHGFARLDDVLVCAFENVRVEIAFTARLVTANAYQGEDRRRLGAAPLSHNLLEVNQMGVLEGLGLSASWLVHAHRTGRLPPWFTDEYAEAVGMPREASKPAL